MLVDPNVLRAFADQVDAAAAVLKDVDLAATASSAADGLPGSDTQWAMRQVGEHLGLAADDIVKDVSGMGAAVRGAGDRYEVEDDALADDFKNFF